MAGNKVKYSDLIQDDGALDRLLDKLEQTAATFEGLVSTAKSSARDISNSLNSMSSATQAGRDSILAANAAVANLKSATAQLKVSISDTSQAVTGLKAAISENTTVTAKSYSAIEQAIGKYDRLKSDLQDYMNLYKSLTTQEKSSPFGQQTLEEITKLASRVNALTANLRALTKTQKERLTIDEQETNSLRKLADAQSDANVKRYENNQALREANRIAALNAKLRNAEPGSYQAISAQYALNKIELSKLNVTSETASERTRKLVADTYLLYQRMKQFQEATGVHTLSVGNYTKVWDGLGYSVAQVVREIPNAAIGMRTFFIAISNNIPILADQIMQVRKENEALRAQGKPTVSAIMQVGRALMSWNTILTVVLTVLNLFGDEIIKWVRSLFKGEAAVMSMTKAIRNLNKELENSNDSYGDNMASFKKLQNQWAALTTEAEKTEWMKNHEEALKNLGEAAETVADVERILVERADTVEETFRRRAEAAAAAALATEEYEKALVANAKAEQKKKEIAEFWTKTYNNTIDRFYADRFGYTEEDRQKLYRTPDYYLENWGNYVQHIDTSGRWGSFPVGAKPVNRLKSEAKAAEEAAEQYLKLGAVYDDLQDKDEGSEGPEGPEGPEGRDLTDRIYKARLEARKKYEKSQTALIKDEYDRREEELKDAAEAEIEALKETRRKAIEWRDDPENNYKDLTEDEQKAIQEILEKSSDNIIAIREKLNNDLAQLAIDRRISTLKIQEETNSLLLQTVKKGSIDEYNLRKRSIELQYHSALLENEKLKGTGQEKDTSIITEAYAQQTADLANDWAILYKEDIINAIELRLQAVREGSEEEYYLKKSLLDKELELELYKNKQLAEGLQMDEDAIKASYARREKLLEGEYKLNTFKQGQSATRARYIADDKAGNTGIKSKQLNDYYLGIFDLEQEIALLEKQIEMAGQGLLEWSPEQIAEAEAIVEKLNKDLDETKDIWNLIGEKGIGAGILTQLGFEDDQIDALSNATNIVIEQINAIMAAEVEAAEKAVELAQERVDAFQSAYDAEIEARNNGYANNVATAKKELEQEKKNQREKQKILEQAQKRQEAVNSVTQASSLITASAQLWASMTQGTGILGPALALAAIAAMWTSFGVSKAKAKQVAETYGDGGLEFLEGGSHASGHDIDLGTTNSKGKRMRAEGGEAMAIINKKNTRKYKAMLPDIIDSLNSGNFEEKYLSSLNTSGLAISVNNATVDISRIEGDVADIKKQNETKYYVVDGYLVIQHKNVKRIIKN